MSWWNPFTWAENTDAEQLIVDQAAHDTLLLAQARADAAAGVITDDDYHALRDTFQRVHGAAALAAFDAAAPAVPAAATIAGIQDYLGIPDIDQSAFQEPARAAAQDKIDAAKDQAVKAALQDIPRQLADGAKATLATLPAWLKWTAAAAAALLILNTLAKFKK
jgi:hypothetical protein